MCNLYTYKLSRDEIRGLMQHYKLIGTEWAEQFESEMRGQNEPALVYPNYLAPVVIDRDGARVTERLRWGMPGPAFPPKPGERPKHPGRVTNVRNTKSGHWRPWLASSSVVVGQDRNKGGRCIVPASAFAEPDRNTANPVVFRWFQRADGLPFFFAGIWREWQGDRGTKAAPNVGLHRVYAFLTTEPNGVVAPIHNKAMPVMLMTSEDIERWLTGTMDEALELQKPANDDAVVMTTEKVAAPL
jgi:putative SOS response-associated peptidase YedK